jgi:cytochrome oxidase Cu insertion factor (SCO1/SenC/PrrC family)
MKKILLFFALFAFSFAGYSQAMSDDGRCILEGHMGSNLVKVADEIGDFTITDSDGITWNLYDELNAGKTVLIDLFYST